MPAREGFGILAHVPRAFVLLLAAAILLGPVSATAATLDPSDHERLGELFDELTRGHLETLPIPGAVLAVVHAGELVLSRGYGYADLEANVPMDAEHTLVRAGSASKPLTWAAVLQLVDRGLLDLDADVNRYLDFEIAPTHPAAVTLRHLMTHTPGFEDVGERLFVLDHADLVTLGTYLRELQPRRIHPPGEVQAYSNYGTALAGYIVEHVSGMPYEAYADEHLLEPLGMSRTTWRQTAEPAPEHAVGYGHHAGAFVRAGFEYVTPVPAGAMSTTANDMATFLVALLGHGDDALGGGVRGAMHARAFAPDPRLGGVTLGLMERRVSGDRLLFHDGSTFSFHASIVVFPEHDLGWFVAYNGPGGTTARRELFDAVATALTVADPAPAVDQAAALSRDVSGEYHLARAEHSGMGKVLAPLTSVQVRSDATGLLVTHEGLTHTYRPVGDDLYRSTERGGLLVVHEDERGRTWISFDSGSPFDAFNATSIVRAPPHATTGALLAVLVLPLLVYLLSLIAWGIGGLRGRRGADAATHRSPPAVGRTSLGVVVTAALHASFIVAFVLLLTDIDTAFGVPRVLFGPTPLLGAVLWLPWSLVAASVALLASIVAVIRTPGSNGGPGAAGRVHLALVGLSACLMLGGMSYWNLLQVPL